MKKILTDPKDVWSYFQENKERLKTSMDEIAFDSDFKMEIFVTNTSDLPEIVVTCEDVQIYSELTVSASNCEDTSERIYSDYLGEDEEEANKCAESSVKLQEMIAERECELDDAIYAFLQAITDGAFDELEISWDECEGFKDDILEYIASNYEAIPIKRPMFLEDEDGNPYFEQYPYSPRPKPDPDVQKKNDGESV